MDGIFTTSTRGRKRRISRASSNAKGDQSDISYTSTEPPQKRPSRHPPHYPGAPESLNLAVTDMPCTGLDLAQQPKPLLPLPLNGSALSDVGKAQALKDASSIEVREDNPEAILGLEHLVLELPQEDQTKDAPSEDEDLDHSTGEDSLEDSSCTDDELEEEDEDGEGGEHLEGEDFSSLTIPLPHQAELMNRLINDSLSFSELTAIMGGGGDPEADLCPSLDATSSVDQQLLETGAVSAHITAVGLSSDTADGVGPSVATSSKPKSAGVAGPLPSDVMPTSKKIAVTSATTESAAGVAEYDDEDQTEKNMHPAARFEQELCEQQRLQLRRGRGRGRSGRGRGSRLPINLAALMGEANVCVGKNKIEEAIKMCLEIIRQFPNSFLPYETLAMIYEERGMQNKSLQFQLMTAFLSPVPDKWIDLAGYYKGQDELEQAVYCYSRAIKQSPTTLSYHWSRSELLERMGNPARALKCYTYMLKFLKPKHAEGGLKLAKEIAKLHFSQQNYSGARQALETAFLRYPDHVSHEDINLLLDVLFTIKAYADGLLVLQTYAGVKLVPKDKSLSSEPPLAQLNRLPLSEQLPLASVCLVPPDLPIDLRSKLTVCLIMNGAFHIAEPLITRLMSESTEEFGDLFIDAAEAFLSAGGGSLALPLLRRLLECPRHGVAATVWRLYAEALVASGGSSDDAVQAYYRVVELAPCNALVRLTLSAMLEEQALHDAALSVLTQTEQPYDCQVLFRKCELLYQREMHDEFVSTVAMLLGRHCVNIRSRDEAEVLINNKKASNKFEGLRELRRSKGEPIEDEEPQYSGEDVPLPDQWSLFVRACSLLYTQKRFAELERLTYSALGSREFMKEHMRDVEFFCLQASMANNDSYFAFNLMRDIVVRYPHNFRVWNLLNQVIIRADDFRHNRFLLRLSQKHPENLALSMLNGHNCLVAGTYKYSLAEYMKVFKGGQTDPLASLMLGLTYIHMACQKFSADKNTLVTQAWVFLNSYRELRGDCQESLYNIGRAMHQLNLLHQAIHYYELALQCPKPVARPGEPSMDLTKEIAMNLSYLYKRGSPNLARYYIRKYITV